MGAPKDANGVPAVTLQAGEQWFGVLASHIFIEFRLMITGIDVYRAAANQKVLVLGGSARTVGAAGGYLLGGGHSPFAHDYGLAVDSKLSIRISNEGSTNQGSDLLEMSIVSADGKHHVINQHSDPDYFWAVRGGGGSAWGVSPKLYIIEHFICILTG